MSGVPGGGRRAQLESVFILLVLSEPLGCPRIDDLPFFRAAEILGGGDKAALALLEIYSFGCTSTIWIISSESISSTRFNIELMEESHQKLFMFVRIISLSQVGDPDAKASLHDSPGISGIASGSPGGG